MNKSIEGEGLFKLSTVSYFCDLTNLIYQFRVKSKNDFGVLVLLYTFLFIILINR